MKTVTVTLFPTPAPEKRAEKRDCHYFCGRRCA